jgi:DNA-binding IclR family transcriptional regulator
MRENSARPSGTQSASKMLTLLRLVGLHHPEGVRLRDLIAASGVDRSTAHRLLQCMVDEGFIERVAPGKQYRLGMESVQLGLDSSGMAPVVERFRPVVQRIARQTGDTVFLMLRSGDHALCLHRQEGAHSVRAHIVETGNRRLLGLSSVGVGVLARLPDAETDAHHARHGAEYARLDVPLARLRRLVQGARRAGFAEMTDMHTEVTSGVGCAFMLSSNSYAGLSIASVNARMPVARRRELGALLLRESAPLAWSQERAGDKP